MIPQFTEHDIEAMQCACGLKMMHAFVLIIFIILNITLIIISALPNLPGSTLAFS